MVPQGLTNLAKEKRVVMGRILSHDNRDNIIPGIYADEVQREYWQTVYPEQCCQGVGKGQSNVIFGL